MKAVQCRMARAALRIGVRELAEMACVSTSTISKLERGESLMSRTAEAVKRELEAIIASVSACSVVVLSHGPR